MNTIKKTSTLFAITLAIASLAACSSKSKKTSTVPQAKSSAAGPSKTVAGDKSDSSTTNPDDKLGDKVAPSLARVVYFPFDSSQLDPDARQQLTNNAKWMKEDSSRTIRIEGHTDEKGTPEYNVALGERRARVAMDYLVRMGISAARIRIITYGEEKPASEEDSENRRSVFIATKKK